MNDDEYSNVSDADLALIDDVCSGFDAQLQAGNAVTIEEQLVDVPDHVRETLTAELIATEINFRRRRDGVAETDEYQTRFPNVDLSTLTELIDEQSAGEPDDTASFERTQISAMTAAASNERTALQQIGPYRLLEEVGRGGMGAVYKSIHTKLDRIVAIKLLSPQIASNAEAIARFEREMKAVGSLQHPNIVQATDAGELEGVHFLAMEFVEGMDVSSLLRQRQAISVADAVEINRQAALGLQAAHEKGMVHRDIKPSNLIVAKAPSGGAAPVVKILDLGLAQLGQDAARKQMELSGSDTILGTVAYMAPEQASSSRVDIRADIYALGCTLYRLLTGRLPFSQDEYDSPLKLMMAKSTQDAPSIGSVRAELPDGLVQIVDRMLIRESDRRFENPGAVAAALAPFAVGTNLHALLEGDRQHFSGGPKAKHGKQEASSETRTSLLRTRYLFPTVMVACLSLIAWMNVPESGSYNPSEVTEKSGSSAPEQEAVESPLPPQPAEAPFSRAEAVALQRSWAEYLGEAVERTNSVGMKLRLIPPGEFLMGAPEDDPDASENERPQHRVSITKPLWIGETEVTVGQFRKFAEATDFFDQADDSLAKEFYLVGADSDWDFSGADPGDDKPAVFVTWADAKRFCDWLSSVEDAEYRLPTEAEWEYACRAGSTSRYYFGDSLQEDQANWGQGLSGNMQPVGSYPDNSFGLYDMHGNAHEICWDSGRTYTSKPTTDPTGSMELEVPAAVRGGSKNSSVRVLRSSHRYLTDSRYDLDQDGAHTSKGFRIVMVAPDVDSSSSESGTSSTQQRTFWRFDGATNYIHVPDVTQSTVDALTMEAWVRPQQQPVGKLICRLDGPLRVQLGKGVDTFFAVEGRTSKTYVDTVTLKNMVPQCPPGQWHHIALVIDNSESRFYVNGRKCWTCDRTAEYRSEGWRGFYIGAHPHEGDPDVIDYFFHGDIDEIRVTEAAVYDGDFEPEQRLETLPENLVLYHFDNPPGTILLDSGRGQYHADATFGTWEDVPNQDVTVQAVEEPIGARRTYWTFDGRSTFVHSLDVVRNNADESTLEVWIRPRPQDFADHVICHLYDTPRLHLGRRPTELFGMDGRTQLAHAGSISYNDHLATFNPRAHRWHHLAVVTTSLDTRLYLNGQRCWSLLRDIEAETIEQLGLYIGAQPRTDGSGQYTVFYDGDIDELRLSNIARYQEDFVPPLRFTSDTQTAVLYHFDDPPGTTLTDSSGHKLHGQPSDGNWSGSTENVEMSAEPSSDPGPDESRETQERTYWNFDGKTNYVHVADVRRNGQERMTLEAWVRPDPDKNSNSICSIFEKERLQLGRRDGELFGREGCTVPASPKAIAAGDTIAYFKPKDRRWHHVAIVTRSSESRFYLDGRRCWTMPRTLTPEERETLGFFIGAAPYEKMSYHFVGGIDEIRLSKSERYTADFEPELRLSGDDETLLLFHFDDEPGTQLTDSSGNDHHGKASDGQWSGSK